MFGKTNLKKQENIIIQHKGDGTADCFMGNSFLGNKSYPLTLDLNINQGAIEIFDSSGIEFELTADNRKIKVLPGGMKLTPVEFNTRQLILDCAASPAVGSFMTIGIYQSPKNAKQGPQYQPVVLQPNQIKFLSNKININNSTICVESIDPRVTAYNAIPGSIMLNHQGLILCKLDEGLSINWRDISRDLVTTNIEDISNVHLNNLQNGQCLVFDIDLGWINAPFAQYERRPTIIEPIDGDRFSDEIYVRVEPSFNLWDLDHKGTRWQLSYSPTFDMLIYDDYSETDLLEHTFLVSGSYTAYLRVQFYDEEDHPSLFSKYKTIIVDPLFAEKPVIAVSQITFSSKLITPNSAPMWDDATDIQRATFMYITATGSQGDYSYKIGDTEHRITVSSVGTPIWDDATPSQRLLYSYIGDEDGKIDGYTYLIGDDE